MLNYKIKYFENTISVLSYNLWWEGLSNVSFYSQYDEKTNTILCSKKVNNQKCKNKNCLKNIINFISNLITNQIYDFMSFQECTLELIHQIKKTNKSINLQINQNKNNFYCLTNSKLQLENISNGLELIFEKKYNIIVFRNEVVTIMTIIHNNFFKINSNNKKSNDENLFENDEILIFGGLIVSGRPFIFTFLKKHNICHINLHAPHNNTIKNLLSNDKINNNGEILNNGLVMKIKEYAYLFNSQTKIIINGDFNSETNLYEQFLNFTLYSEKTINKFITCCNKNDSEIKTHSYDHILSNLKFKNVFIPEKTNNEIFYINKNSSDHSPIVAILYYNKE